MVARRAPSTAPPGRPVTELGSAAATDPAAVDAVGAALIGIRGAKSQAKVSMRAELSRVEITGPEALVARRGARGRRPARGRQDRRRPGVHRQRRDRDLRGQRSWSRPPSGWRLALARVRGLVGARRLGRGPSSSSGVVASGRRSSSSGLDGLVLGRAPPRRCRAGSSRSVSPPARRPVLVAGPGPRSPCGRVSIAGVVAADRRRSSLSGDVGRAARHRCRPESGPADVGVASARVVGDVLESSGVATSEPLVRPLRSVVADACRANSGVRRPWLAAPRLAARSASPASATAELVRRGDRRTCRLRAESALLAAHAGDQHHAADRGDSSEHVERPLVLGAHRETLRLGPRFRPATGAQSAFWPMQEGSWSGPGSN